MSFKQAQVAESATVGEHTFTANVPAQVCAQCEATFFEAAHLERFELRVAVELARAGVSSPEALRFMRKALQLRAAELASLLDVTPETLSRWENGRWPVERRTLALLGTLVIDKFEGRTSTQDQLRALCHPRPLARTTELELAPA